MRAYRYETRRRGLSFYADGHEQTINDPWANDLCGYGYGYNGDNQKTSCAEYGYNGGSYANVAWGYDPLGHLGRETRSGGSARTASYVVDGVGNRTSQTVNGATTTFSYATDELTGDSAGGAYTYDANGNENGRRRGGAWVYPYYTNENQIAVIYNGGSTPAYNYSYDALGRQVSRTDASGTRTDYQYDGDAVLTERQGGSTTGRARLVKVGCR